MRLRCMDKSKCMNPEFSVKFSRQDMMMAYRMGRCNQADKDFHGKDCPDAPEWLESFCDTVRRAYEYNETNKWPSVNTSTSENVVKLHGSMWSKRFKKILGIKC